MILLVNFLTVHQCRGLDSLSKNYASRIDTILYCITIIDYIYDYVCANDSNTFAILIIIFTVSFLFIRMLPGEANNY